MAAMSVEGTSRGANSAPFGGSEAAKPSSRERGGTKSSTVES